MKIKIGLLQMNVEMGNPRANFAKAKSMIEQAMEKEPDVLVLPETWDCGFFPANVAELADPDGAAVKDFLGNLAKQYGVNIVGGTTACKIGPDLFNRCHVFDRQGRVAAVYDKIHGFSLSGEPGIFRMGNSLAHFTLDGLSCAVAVCYDIRFPELIRRNALQGCDLLFIPAAWPKVRNTHWVRLNQARAIENQFYVAAVNQAGRSGNTLFAGQSLLLDPWGEDICHLEDDEEIAFGRVDTDVIREVRSTINVFMDRRPDIDRVE